MNRFAFRSVLVPFALFVASALAFACAGGAPTAPQASPKHQAHRASDTAALLSLEAERFAAMVANDTAALEVLLDDELRYGHSNGKVESKSEFLATLAAKKLRYLAIEPRDARVRFVGDDGRGANIAVGEGVVEMKVATDAGELAITARYLDVWVRRGGAWKLVAWQSAKLP